MNFVTLKHVNHFGSGHVELEECYAPYTTAVINLHHVISVKLTDRLPVTRMTTVHHTRHVMFKGMMTMTTREPRPLPGLYVYVYTVTLSNGDKFETITDIRGLLK